MEDDKEVADECSVIYYSKFGHTKLLAETIAGGLDPNGNARAIDIEIFDPAGLAEADLVVMENPQHKMNLPDAMAAAMGVLPRGLATQRPSRGLRYFLPDQWISAAVQCGQEAGSQAAPALGREAHRTPRNILRDRSRRTAGRWGRSSGPEAWAEVHREHTACR